MATKLKGIKVLDRSISGEDSRFCVVLGAQWGDEGKGKLVDILAQDVQLCARFNGGANAGHTLLVDGKKYAFHLLPCGMINQACKNLIGNGVVVHVPTLMRELQELKEFDPRALERVFISTRAHILFDSHQIIDGILEAEQGTNSIGTTKRGIGPCYSAKAIRNGLRFGDLLHFEEFERRLRELIAWSQKRFGDPRERDTPAQLQLRKALREYNTKYAFDPEEGKKGGVSNVEEEIARYRQFAELLRPQIVDSVTLIHEDISRGYKVLVEGANAALLDIDFGTYPFVTSSNTTVGSVCTGLGVPPKQIDTVIGVVKAYTTRVGHGPFPTELQNEAQTLDDHLETYIGPAQSMARKGHSSGPYELKPDQQVRVGEMLQEVGHEYGTTTGRRRRCGWLDLALVKYSAMVNGFDSINLTKLDVLTGLRQIRIAIAYRNKQMTEVRLPPGYFPSHLEDLKEVVCEYETMQGWSEDISKVTDFADLPTNAKKYVLRIQELLGIPVSWVGVGPDRSSMLKVDIPIVRPDGSISAFLRLVGRELAEAQQEGLRGAFLRLDCDGDGALSASDLSAGLRGTTPDEHRDRDSSGLFPTLSLRAQSNDAEDWLEEIRSLVATAGTVGDKIGFSDFLAVMLPYHVAVQEAQLRSAFSRLADSKGSGRTLLPKSTLQTALQVGQAVSEEEVAALNAGLPEELSYVEFVQLVGLHP
ncbi:unnamed protein product [Symbiodinium microadriaticum]|nr:unnamed protein product [Symbiodinium microadriaticum]